MREISPIDLVSSGPKGEAYFRQADGKTGGGVLSLGLHVFEKHNGRQVWFAQMVCDGNIASL